MRVRLEGNHSASHCGCAAVWKSINSVARRNGLHVVNARADFDALIVNGEGSMHHSRKNFRSKMKTLADALNSEKRAYLVKSVWQENNSEYDDVLRNLSGIWVREVDSQRDLLERHGIASVVSIDLSFFYRERPWVGFTNFSGEPVMTDFYSHEFENFAVPKVAAVRGMKRALMKGRSWGSLVASLKTAAFLATGRHHAVYAACQARIPFAAVEGNTYKISGLIKSAGLNIPVARSLAELPEVMASIDTHRPEYEKLFDWMEAQNACHSLPTAA